MKRIIFCLLAVCMTSCCWSKCLRLTLTDGTQVYYQLGGEKNPMLRLTENGLTINTDAYTFEGISSFKVLDEDAPNSLEYVRDELKSSTLLKVYDLEGKEIEAEDAETATLPAGVYILKSGNASLKIVKR